METIDKRVIRQEFEFWVKEELWISTERYTTFPFSYKMHELNGMFAAWEGAKKKYEKNNS